MKKLKDIEGNILKVGDNVYYARKRNYTNNGEMLKLTITNINCGKVRLGKYTSTDPQTQLLKRD